MNYQITQ